MADYFTNFSLIVALPSAVAETYALDLAEQALQCDREDTTPDDQFPTALQEVLEDWRFETERAVGLNGHGLWLHSSDGGIDAVCLFIQHLLQRFDPTGAVSLEWSNDCSKPRTDAFGGGAALITAANIKHINTGQWLQRQIARLHPSNQPAVNASR